MGLNAYLTLTGATQGQIQGSVTRTGLEGAIEVIETKHLVHWPLDAVSGLPMSSKKHKPITITKEVDASSPLLFTMWSTNEDITQCRLDFYRTTSAGTKEQYYSIELENASITSIRFEQPNNRDPEKQSYAEMEQVTFVYGKIIYTHQPTGNSAEEGGATF